MCTGLFKGSAEYLMVPQGGEVVGRRTGFEESFGIDNMGIRSLQYLPLHPLVHLPL